MSAFGRKQTLHRTVAGGYAITVKRTRQLVPESELVKPLAYPAYGIGISPLFDHFRPKTDQKTPLREYEAESRKFLTFGGSQLNSMAGTMDKSGVKNKPLIIQFLIKDTGGEGGILSPASRAQALPAIRITT